MFYPSTSSFIFHSTIDICDTYQKGARAPRLLSYIWLKVFWTNYDFMSVSGKH